jgi:serine/threonine protein kinase/alpha-tubulin suppressor-like RCC1 family protein
MADDDVEIPVTEPERPVDDAVPHLWPAELDADYTLVGELGRGGMAVVFRARDRDLGREVAVKVVRPRFAADEEAVARLAREARTVAQLEHPNIVGVYSIRHLGDRSVALVMQLIPGRTLKQAVTEDGPFDATRAEQVLRDVARALAYAHRAGVVHRDVKPENIFLDATSGRAMLSDFGVARVMDAPTELTATGTTIGTPTYMAPEQIDGIHLDGRSDLYSLGMVGWEMLTGERPWAGESLYSVIYRQKHDQLPPIDSFREDIPARTQYLIEGLMPKNPDRRWASAARFLTLLASDQPPPGYKDWESAQRRRRRTRVFQQARRRGDSVIGAALETVKFSRPPTPVAPLAQSAERKTPVAPAPDVSEQYFEPTGEAATAKLARPKTPAGVGAAAMVGAAGALARGTPSGGFSIQRPPHEANTRLTPGVLTIPPKRSRLVRFGIGTAVLAGLSVLAWIQFGPARAAEVQFLDSPNVPRDDRAIDVPVVTPPADSLAQRATDSTLAAAQDSSAAAAAHTPPLSPPNARLGGIRPAADSGRLAATPPVSDVRTAPRVDSTPRPEVSTAPPPTTPPPPAFVFRKDADMIAAGRGHSCVLTDSRAACWGSNDNGELGDGTEDSRSEPARVAGVFTFSRISAGWNYTCGLTTGSEVVCWGANTTGQLGDGTTQSRSAPVRINSTASFRLIRTSREHTCGLSNSYAVICWGSNTDGQLGDGTKQRRNSPVMVELPANVADVTVGFAHTCALTSDGTAWCWGKNDDGQLGDGYASSRSVPARVKFDGQFVSIAAGAYHTCAVTPAGEAWCWGRNTTGQLGFAGANASTPHLVTGAPPFSTVSAGLTFTCARGRDSSAWCWGLNNNGQLGDGTLSSRPVPTQVKALSSSRLASLNAGSGHVCAVSDRAEAYCWGTNVDGQIGRVDRDGSPIPVRILVPPR